LPERLEEAIFIEVQEDSVVVFKLLVQEAIVQLNLRVLIDGKRRDEGDFDSGKRP
jgi:hypothetical protein